MLDMQLWSFPVHRTWFCISAVICKWWCSFMVLGKFATTVDSNRRLLKIVLQNARCYPNPVPFA